MTSVPALRIIIVVLATLVACSSALAQSDPPRSVADDAREQALMDRVLRDYRERARSAALADIARAREPLALLREQAAGLLARLTSLRTDAEGRRLALDASTVTSIFHRDLLSAPLSLDAIDQRVRDLDAVEARLRAAPPDTLERVIAEATTLPSDTRAWAVVQSSAVSERSAFFDAATRRVRADTPVADTAPTLAEALDTYIVEYNRWVSRLFEAGAGAGRAQAEPEAIERGRLAALLRAEQDLRILEERHRTALEHERVRHRAELERRLDEIAALERQNNELRARRALEDARAEAATGAVQRETDLERRRERARAPEVRSLLSNLSAPGLRQPGRGGNMSREGTRRGPVSLGALRSCGALQDSVQGLGVLLEVVTDGRDTERPRMVTSRRDYRNLTADEKDRVMALQRTINELHDALVAEGLLAP